MTDERSDRESESLSEEEEKSQVVRTTPNRRPDPRWMKGDLVQMDVKERDRNNQEVIAARYFFIYESKYNEEKRRWEYRLDVEENGKAGKPYKAHKRHKERDLKGVR